MKELVSIILPVYAVEKYIENSIDSVLMQSYKNLEIIIIDDGSPDNSAERAGNLLNKSIIPFKIVKQKNQGVSAARNKGIEIASGKWVLCIDPDDTIEPDYVSVLVSFAERNKLSVVFANFQNVFLDKKIDHNIEEISAKEYNKNELINLYLKRKINLLAPGLLLEKSFLDKNKIKYDSKVIFAEDVQYIWRVLFASEVVGYIENKLYNYLIRPDSTVTSSNSSKILNGYTNFLDFKEEVSKEVSKEFAELLIARWVFAALHLGAHTLDYKDYKSLAVKMKYRKYIKNLFRFPDIRINILSVLLAVNLRLFKYVMEVKK